MLARLSGIVFLAYRDELSTSGNPFLPVAPDHVGAGTWSTLVLILSPRNLAPAVEGLN